MVGPDVRVSPLREDSPPCLRLAVRGDRVAYFEDFSLCPAATWGSPRFAVEAGALVGWGSDFLHPGRQSPRFGERVLEEVTDDPAEAKAAYARACEWVRTGELL
ncbi:hypothetical protein LCGC14_1509320 [marine sediment metagenome]|uniref:Uncharacterized protein n=1 Tax=marine sediment metagenome TaxID=412755 RepID=A0A0F9JMK5_9ZZZZ